jgi:hypothetical protein
MKKTEYLYGIAPTELDNKEYWEALAFKVNSGQKLYEYLLEHGPRDREFHCFKALSHTKKLLEEREEYTYG